MGTNVVGLIDTSPEGALALVPGLPLHWFVHSLASRATYRLVTPSGVIYTDLIL